MISIPPNYVFGFRDMDQFYDWFSDAEIDALKMSGYQIYLYEVESEFVISGGNQVCFRESAAILVDTYEIGTI